MNVCRVVVGVNTAIGFRKMGKCLGHASDNQPLKKIKNKPILLVVSPEKAF